MRLVKNGLVRETDSQREIGRLTALGYAPVEDGTDADSESSVRTVMINTLMRQTVEQLREHCLQRGLEPPASAKKAELAEAVAEYDLAHYGGMRDG